MSLSINVRESINQYMATIGLVGFQMKVDHVTLKFGSYGNLCIEACGKTLLVGIARPTEYHDLETVLQDLMEHSFSTIRGPFDFQVGLRGKNQVIVATQLHAESVSCSSMSNAVNALVDFWTHVDRRTRGVSGGGF